MAWRTTHTQSSWKHSGFSVDQSVRLQAEDQEGVRRLIQYFLRCPFSQARMIEVTQDGEVIYKSEHNTMGRFPEPGDEVSSLWGRAQDHRIHPAAPDRGDREDSAPLRIVEGANGPGTAAGPRDG